MLYQKGLFKFDQETAVEERKLKFKPVKFRWKSDLVSHPSRAEGFGKYTHRLTRTHSHEYTCVCVCVCVCGIYIDKEFAQVPYRRQFLGQKLHKSSGI